ncbi:MAG: 3D domain-containing protein [Armatimonadota bacterium]|nr:3D domain-containing protein [Armatimonadota bacterium]MDW8143791.1 3D domain-containing protein [Armatimonadota bacterium]
MHQLRWTLAFATVMGCAVSVVWLAIAQTEQSPETRPENPKQATTKQAIVQGFEDVIRAQKSKAETKLNQKVVRENVAEEIVISESTKEAWLKVISSFNLNLPSRPEGWKFANYTWLRWRGTLASRAGVIRHFRLMRMVATAYCPRGCCGSSSGRTATGRKAEYGVVAVDPRVIPLGTTLYVDRYGFAIAADTGRKIKGNRIDLCYPTHREASRFGRRTVKVLVLR